MTALSLMLCLFQYQTDPVASQQATVAMHRSNVPVVQEPANVGPSDYLKKVQLRRFEERFNKLVQAVEEFSVAYNGTKGRAWPNDKAQALRKAMAELQKIDPSFKPDKDNKATDTKATVELPATAPR